VSQFEEPSERPIPVKPPVGPQVETVLVKTDMYESGFMRINALDFDEEIHELYEEEDAEAQAAVAPRRSRR